MCDIVCVCVCVWCLCEWVGEKLGCKTILVLVRSCYHKDHTFIFFKSRQSFMVSGWSLQGPVSSSVQFRWVAQLCPTLCDPMSHSMPGLPVQHMQQWPLPGWRLTEAEWKLSTIPNKAAWKGILIKAKAISFENNFIKYSQMRELTTFFT